MIEFLKKLLDLPAIIMQFINLFRKTTFEKEQSAKKKVDEKIDEMGKTGRG